MIGNYRNWSTFLKLHNNQDLFYRAGIKNIDVKTIAGI